MRDAGPDATMPRMKRILLAVLALLVLLAIVGVLLLDSSRDETTTVDADDAAKIAGASAPDEPIDRGARPEPGTYEYVGSGREHLSLLGGSSHEFPERITGVVQLDPNDACAWTLDLVLIEEHTEERAYCTFGAGVLDAGFSRTTTFLGREQTSAYRCDDDALRVRTSATGGDSWSWTCTEERGGKVRFTATLVGREQLTIDDEPIDTAHVRLTARQRDKSVGDERGDWWFADTGLPVRIRSDRTLTTTAGPLGEMKTTEAFEYELASLAPTALDRG